MMFSLFKTMKSISTTELAQKNLQDIVLLDVRTPAEYKGGHIRQAKSKPLNQISTYNGKTPEVYVICQSGMRSKQAAKQLKKKGYDVTNIRGGMNQWSGKVVGGK